MDINDLIKQQRALQEKVDKLCTQPIASSSEEATLWQTEHAIYLTAKENILYGVRNEL